MFSWRPSLFLIADPCCRYVFEWLRGRTLISESVAPHQRRVHAVCSRPRETEQVRAGWVLDAKKNPVVNVPSALTGLFTVTSKQAPMGTRCSSGLGSAV